MSDQIKITINGVECTGNPGETILQIATRHNVYIPNLCNDERVKHFGACGLCLVEGEGLPKLMRACATVPVDGWKLSTETPRVKAARKVALELIMSDHDGDCKGPCTLNCPAGTECQLYVKKIAEGDDREAVRIIKEKIALPASIGRVCPHPCETACRRQHVEEPISIAYLKAFAADNDLASGNPYTPEVLAPTGKSVGIIGGGPAGLSAAFFLARKGHKVTVYDQMPEMGGMLRYGIPEYRLPKSIVATEVAEIAKLGVEMKNNFTIGKDASFEDIRKAHDAVLIAIGAWTSMKAGCPGEDAEGVVGGIDLLRRVNMGERPDLGDNVVILGGGNTAMDACRTAVRLGAKNVYVVYRRTEKEMPAEQIEIDEAREEGVEFKFLRNPAEIISENGKVTAVKLQVMELGEPDASGRRSPVAVEGQFETIPVSTFISAIGQKVNPAAFDVELNKKGIIAADEAAFTTNLEGVFAAGDAVNKGAGIAVAAIAEANKAVVAIDSYLKGEIVPYKAPFVSERELDDIDFTEYEKAPRIKMPVRPAGERNKDFTAINLGFSDADARKEAKRCLECGCWDYEDCRLIKTANCCDICPSRLKGEKHKSYTEKKLVTIERNMGKCLLCGLCVRTCTELAGKEILGFVGRGFPTVINPEFNKPETIAACKDCHLCADACPTGALKIIG